MRIFTWRQRLTVVVVNVVSIALFVGVGYLLDSWLDARPVLSIVGLLLSFIVGQVVLAKILVREYHRESKNP